MRILENSELDLTRKCFGEARKEALKFHCYGLKEGAVLVKNNIILGRGSNFHAEQKAINDALNKSGKEIIKGSTLYFTRINGDNSIIPVGKPYCTICSKLALDEGISKWVLFQENGFCEYSAEEYNDISFGLKE